mgnify:CR=1 FL=1
MAHQDWNLRIDRCFVGSQAFCIGEKGGQSENACKWLGIIQRSLQRQYTALGKTGEQYAVRRYAVINLILDKVMNPPH